VKFKTINPATEEVIGEYETMTNKQIKNILASCHSAFNNWKKTAVKHRADQMKSLANILRRDTEQLAKLATLEMGKTIKSARAEVEKCAWCAEIYAEQGAQWLAEEPVKADGKKNIIVFEPLGVVLAVMPWNFPFWQIFRCAIPTLVAGNGMLLRHSNQVPQCAMAIEKIFCDAGFGDLFRTIITDHDAIAQLLAEDAIVGVSLTGSTEAGSKVAAIAGQNLKKVVLELGGSDPFIVLDDANIEIAVKNAVTGRTLNNGQSCIAAKRFIVHEKIAESFSKKFTEAMKSLVVGDPMDEKTDVGPLVNAQALKKVEEQMKEAVKKGATIATGGKRTGKKGYFFMPTVLNVAKDSLVMHDEVFAPCAAVHVIKNDDEAIAVANNIQFGLGGSVWTKNLERGEKIARKIDAGAVFVNSIVKSDPRMPFGGIKKSGIGRELGTFGLREFVNVKTINIYELK